MFYVKKIFTVALLLIAGSLSAQPKTPSVEARFSADSVLIGDQFRLVSPYSGNHAAVMYVTPGQDKAVLFAYDIYAQKYVERSYPIRLQGLDPQRSYRVVEINKMDSVPARPFVEDGKTFSGEYLMKIGLQAFSDFRESSRVIEITAQ
jgi:alpha-galactosidase